MMAMMVILPEYIWEKVHVLAEEIVWGHTESLLAAHTSNLCCPEKSKEGKMFLHFDSEKYMDRSASAKLQQSKMKQIQASSSNVKSLCKGMCLSPFLLLIQVTSVVQKGVKCFCILILKHIWTGQQ